MERNKWDKPTGQNKSKEPKDKYETLTLLLIIVILMVDLGIHTIIHTQTIIKCNG